MAIELRVSEIIGQLQTAAGSNWSNQPWDGLQAGSLDATVKGVAIAWAPELAILKQAVQKGCNLILTKDPVYWCERLPGKSQDGKTARVSEGPGGPGVWAAVEKTELYKIKKDFIESNNLTIYRMAQNWTGADSRTTEGLLKALGWKADRSISVEPNDPNLKTAIVSLPEQSLIELAKNAQTRVGGKAARLLGEVNARVLKVAVHPSYLSIGAITHIAETPNLDVIVTGEGCEWESFEYAEDWISAGRGKGFLMHGLAGTADTAAREVSAWVKSTVPSAHVEFLAAGDPFTPVYPGGLHA